MHKLDDVIFRHHHQIGKEVAAKELQVKLADPSLAASKIAYLDVVGEEEEVGCCRYLGYITVCLEKSVLTLSDGPSPKLP